ncbi:28083_t:CDS:2, partial [Gigaspora margarita]
NYSAQSHTGEFLTNEILDVVDRLGSDRFAAVVTDAASNCRGFTNMKIKGGGLKTWIKTRWGSLYFTTDSMLRARPVFDWMLSEHENAITNQEIKAIYMLKTNNATLADCFIYLIKLAAAIKSLSETNTFKASIVYIFNKRYQEFLHPLYVLAYYIHPQYRG